MTLYALQRKSCLEYRAHISASNTNREIIQKIRDYVGAGYIVRLNGLGNRRIAWQWSLNTKKDLVPLLTRLLPKLYLKRKQAKLLLEFYQHSTLPGRRHTKVDRAFKAKQLAQMRILNHRGQSSLQTKV
jgi:hypothetical protein